GAGTERGGGGGGGGVGRLARHPDRRRRRVGETDAEPGAGAGNARAPAESGRAHGRSADANGRSGEGSVYMSAVVNETLRVRPVVPIVVRMLQRAMRGGAHTLPPATRVAPCIYLSNRNPQVYEEPGGFRPERVRGNPAETCSWIPFGGGIRRCIGAAFAQMEMSLILRTVLSELEPRVPEHSRGWRRGEWIRRRP